MSRLHFYRGDSPEPSPDDWADRWPCTAVIVAAALLAFVLAGGLAVCVALDRLTTRAPAAGDSR